MKASVGKGKVAL